RAESARLQAEELVNFLVRDLHEEMRPLGRLDLLEQAARKSRDYFLSLPAGAGDAESLRNRGAALRNYGDVLMDQGKLLEAAENYRAHIALLETLLAREPDDAGALADLAESSSRLARVHYQQRELADALVLENRSISLWERLARAEPDNPRWRGSWAAA